MNLNKKDFPPIQNIPNIQSAILHILLQPEVSRIFLFQLPQRKLHDDKYLFSEWLLQETQNENEPLLNELKSLTFNF